MENVLLAADSAGWLEMVHVRFSTAAPAPGTSCSRRRHCIIYCAVRRDPLLACRNYHEMPHAHGHPLSKLGLWGKRRAHLQTSGPWPETRTPDMLQHAPRTYQHALPMPIYVAHLLCITRLYALPFHQASSHFPEILSSTSWTARARRPASPAARLEVKRRVHAGLVRKGLRPAGARGRLRPGERERFDARRRVLHRDQLGVQALLGRARAPEPRVCRVGTPLGCLGAAPDVMLCV